MSPGRQFRLSERQVVTDLAVEHLHPPLLPLLLRLILQWCCFACSSFGWCTGWSCFLPCLLLGGAAWPPSLGAVAFFLFFSVVLPSFPSFRWVFPSLKLGGAAWPPPLGRGALPKNMMGWVLGCWAVGRLLGCQVVRWFGVACWVVCWVVGFGVGVWLLSVGWGVGWLRGWGRSGCSVSGLVLGSS